MLLFVCTGNTCRSPLAAAIARARGVAAESAGLAAFPGEGASSGAIRAAARRGIDLKAHRARPVTPALMREAEAVYAMSPAHAAQLARLFPGAGGKVHVFSPPIPDPYGGDDAAYEACAEALTDAMEEMGLIPRA